MADILKRADGRGANIHHRDAATVLTRNAIHKATTAPAEQEINTPDKIYTMSVRCNWCAKEIVKLDCDPHEIFGENIPEANPDTGLIDFVANYDPCLDCLKLWNESVVIFETTSYEPYEDCLTINEDKENPLYPTGRYIGINPDDAKQSLPDAKPGAVYFMDEENFSDSFGDIFSKL